MPYDFYQIVDRYDKAKQDPDFADMSLVDFSTLMNEVSGTQDFDAGLTGDNWFRRAMATKQRIEAPMVEPMRRWGKAAGGGIADLVGAGEEGRAKWESSMEGALGAIPSLAVDVGAALGVGAALPYLGASAGVAGLASLATMGGMAAAGTYGATGDIPQSLISGAGAALMPKAMHSVGQKVLSKMGAPSFGTLYADLLTKVQNVSPSYAAALGKELVPKTLGQVAGQQLGMQVGGIGLGLGQQLLSETIKKDVTFGEALSETISPQNLAAQVVMNVPFVAFDVAEGRKLNPKWQHKTTKRATERVLKHQLAELETRIPGMRFDQAHVQREFEAAWAGGMPQKPAELAGSIADNVAFARDDFGSLQDIFKRTFETSTVEFRDQKVPRTVLLEWAEETLGGKFKDKKEQNDAASGLVEYLQVLAQDMSLDSAKNVIRAKTDSWNERSSEHFWAEIEGSKRRFAEREADASAVKRMKDDPEFVKRVAHIFGTDVDKADAGLPKTHFDTETETTTILQSGQRDVRTLSFFDRLVGRHLKTKKGRTIDEVRAEREALQQSAETLVKLLDDMDTREQTPELVTKKTELERQLGLVEKRLDEDTTLETMEKLGLDETTESDPDGSKAFQVDVEVSRAIDQAILDYSQPINWEDSKSVRAFEAKVRGAAKRAMLKAYSQKLSSDYVTDENGNTLVGASKAEVEIAAQEVLKKDKTYAGEPLIAERDKGQWKIRKVRYMRFDSMDAEERETVVKELLKKQYESETAEDVEAAREAGEGEEAQAYETAEGVSSESGIDIRQTTNLLQNAYRRINASPELSVRLALHEHLMQSLRVGVDMLTDAQIKTAIETAFPGVSSNSFGPKLRVDLREKVKKVLSFALSDGLPSVISFRREKDVDLVELVNQGKATPEQVKLAKKGGALRSEGVEGFMADYVPQARKLAELLGVQPVALTKRNFFGGRANVIEAALAVADYVVRGIQSPYLKERKPGLRLRKTMPQGLLDFAEIGHTVDWADRFDPAFPDEVLDRVKTTVSKVTEYTVEDTNGKQTVVKNTSGLSGLYGMLKKTFKERGYVDTKQLLGGLEDLADLPNMATAENKQKLKELQVLLQRGMNCRVGVAQAKDPTVGALFYWYEDGSGSPGIMMSPFEHIPGDRWFRFKSPEKILDDLHHEVLHMNQVFGFLHDDEIRGEVTRLHKYVSDSYGYDDAGNRVIGREYLHSLSSPIEFMQGVLRDPKLISYMKDLVIDPTKLPSPNYKNKYDDGTLLGRVFAVFHRMFSKLFGSPAMAENVLDRARQAVVRAMSVTQYEAQGGYAPWKQNKEGRWLPGSPGIQTQLRAGKGFMVRDDLYRLLEDAPVFKTWTGVVEADRAVYRANALREIKKNPDSWFVERGLTRSVFEAPEKNAKAKQLVEEFAVQLHVQDAQATAPRGLIFGPRAQKARPDLVERVGPTGGKIPEQENPASQGRMTTPVDAITAEAMVLNGSWLPTAGKGSHAPLATASLPVEQQALMKKILDRVRSVPLEKQVDMKLAVESLNLVRKQLQSLSLGKGKESKAEEFFAGYERTLKQLEAIGVQVPREAYSDLALARGAKDAGEAKKLLVPHLLGIENPKPDESKISSITKAINEYKMVNHPAPLKMEELSATEQAIVKTWASQISNRRTVPVEYTPEEGTITARAFDESGEGAVSEAEAMRYVRERLQKWEPQKPLDLMEVFHLHESVTKNCEARIVELLAERERLTTQLARAKDERQLDLVVRLTDTERELLEFSTQVAMHDKTLAGLVAKSEAFEELSEWRRTSMKAYQEASEKLTLLYEQWTKVSGAKGRELLEKQINAARDRVEVELKLAEESLKSYEPIKNAPLFEQWKTSETRGDADGQNWAMSRDERPLLTRVTDAMQATTRQQVENGDRIYLTPIDAEAFGTLWRPVLGAKLHREGNMYWMVKGSLEKVTERDVRMLPVNRVGLEAQSQFNTIKGYYLQLGFNREFADAMAPAIMEMVHGAGRNVLWHPTKDESAVGYYNPNDDTVGINYTAEDAVEFGVTTRHESAHAVETKLAEDITKAFLKDPRIASLLNEVVGYYQKLTPEQRVARTEALTKFAHEKFNVATSTPKYAASDVHEFLVSLDFAMESPAAVTKFIDKALDSLELDDPTRALIALHKTRQASAWLGVQGYLKSAGFEELAAKVLPTYKFFRQTAQHVLKREQEIAATYTIAKLRPDVLQENAQAVVKSVGAGQMRPEDVENYAAAKADTLAPVSGVGSPESPEAMKQLSWWLKNIAPFVMTAAQYPELRPLYDALSSADHLAKAQVSKLFTAGVGLEASTGTGFVETKTTRQWEMVAKSQKIRDCFSEMALAQQLEGDDKQFKVEHDPATERVKQVTQWNGFDANVRETYYNKHKLNANEREAAEAVYNGTKNQMRYMADIMTNAAFEHFSQVAVLEIVNDRVLNVDQARAFTKALRKYFDYNELAKSDAFNRKEHSDRAQRFFDEAWAYLPPDVPGKPEYYEAFSDVANQLLLNFAKAQDLGKILTGRAGYFMTERRQGSYGVIYTDDKGKTQSFYWKTAKDRELGVKEKRLKVVRNINPNESSAGVTRDMRVFEFFDAQTKRLKERLVNKYGEEKGGEMAVSLDYTTSLEEAIAAQSVLTPVKRRHAKSREMLDMFFVQQEHMNNVIHAIKNRHVKMESEIALAHPAFDIQANLKTYAKRHVQNVLKPDSQIGRSISSMNFAYFMAYNLSNMIVEPFQQLTSLAPVLTLKFGKAAKSYGMIADANKEALSAALRGNYVGELKVVMERAREEGVVDAGIYAELDFLESYSTVNFMRSRGGMRPLNAFDIAKNKLVGLFAAARKFYSKIPTYNSEVAFIAAYKEFRKRGLSVEDAYRESKFVKDHSMFGGGKYNRPVGMFHALPRAMAQTGFSLQTYSTSMMTLMGHLIRKSLPGSGLTPAQIVQHRKAMMQMVMTQMALAGALGMPFLAPAMAAFQKLFPGSNPELAVREVLSQVLGDDEELGGFLGQALAKGLPSVLSNAPDMGARLSLSTTLGISPYNGIDWSNFIGPSASLVNNVIKATKETANLDPQKAVELVMPRGVARMAQALEQGNVFINPNTRDLLATDLSVAEQLGRVVGFTPSRVSRWQDYARLSAQAETAALEAKRRRTTDIARKLQAGQDSDAARLFRKEVQSGNDPRDLMKSVANRLGQLTLPPDPRELGSRAAGPTQGRIDELFGVPQTPMQSTSLARKQLHAAAAQRLGVPTLGPSMTSVRRAAQIDSLVESDPTMSRWEAADLLSNRGTRGRLSPVLSQLYE
jgi:hypothetical protein